MTDLPDHEIARRDELLELLYWIEGEGFDGAATLEALARFVVQPADVVQRALDTLLGRGDVALDPATGEFRLSDTGRAEAARRFAEEFGPMLGQGHGECNDPHCDCHAGNVCRHEGR